MGCALCSFGWAAERRRAPRLAGGRAISSTARGHTDAPIVQHRVRTIKLQAAIAPAISQAIT
jgi:hypothetical protein